MTLIAMDLHRYLARVPILLCIIVAIGLVSKYLSGVDHCKIFLHTGRWTTKNEGSKVERKWQPYEALLHSYSVSEMSKCLENKTLYFVGDSAVRQVFWKIAYILGIEDAKEAATASPKHRDLSYKKHNATMSFLWDPYLNRTDTFETFAAPEATRSVGIVLSAGLWHARYGGDLFLENYSRSVSKTALHGLNTDSYSVTPQIRMQAVNAPMVAIPPSNLNEELLDPERAQTLTAERLEKINQVLANVEASSQLEVAWATRQMSHSYRGAIDSDGLHVTPQVAAAQAEVLLNRICNSKTFAQTRHLGSKTTSVACIEIESRLRIRTGILGVGLAVFAVVPVLAFRCSKSQCLSLANIAGIVCFCWLADRTPLLQKSDKLISMHLFTVMSGMCLAMGLLRVEVFPTFSDGILPGKRQHFAPSPSPFELLPRHQTEEWKGWMQVIILLYHYFGMSKVLWVYRVVRVLVASYLFLTAYGHTSYFQIATSFSIRRIAAVLIRLNLLPCLLAVVMDNTYDFYYFPGLASFWFVVISLTFWSPKTHCSTLSNKIIRILASSTLLKLLLNSEHTIAAITQAIQAVYGPTINAREFRFRVGLDFCAPFFGMLLSVLVHHRVNFPAADLTAFSRHSTHVRSALFTFGGLILLVVYNVIAFRFDSKSAYNRWHSWLSILPISAYIMLRNLSGPVRNNGAPLFVWFGSISLELFVLQYHTWLAADTRGLLRLGLLDTPRMTASQTVVGSWTYWVESLLITINFVWLSHNCAKATSTLVKAVINFDRNNGKDSGTRMLIAQIASVLVVLWVFNVASRVDQAYHGV